jgi:nucleoside-diphosphate-sugar epimerase
MTNSSIVQTPRVLVTGGSGFAGRHLLAELRRSGIPFRTASRRAASADDVVVGDIGPSTDWSAALEDVDAVVHLAAHVHRLNPTAEDAARFRDVNALGTRRLAEEAAKAGVRRLIYLSTIKVLGEETTTAPFDDSTAPAPADPYAESKLAGEDFVRAAAAASGMEFVVLRPPLIYGPGVGANFLRLVRAVERRLPLPLGAIDNRRSLLFSGNLAAALRQAIGEPGVANGTFVIADEPSLSTRELIRRIGGALGRRPLLLPVPPFALKTLGRVTGKEREIARLTGNLEVDASGSRRAGITSPYTTDEGLAATVAWYRESRAAR